MNKLFEVLLVSISAFLAAGNAPATYPSSPYADVGRGGQKGTKMKSGSVPIRVDLSVEPTHMTRQTLPNLTIRGAVTNLGDRTVDPEIVASELLVNGKNSIPWNLAISNGPRDQREYSLPPKEKVEFSRVMGAGLFSAPGHYTLVLRVHGLESHPVDVTLEGE